MELKNQKSTTQITTNDLLTLEPTLEISVYRELSDVPTQNMDVLHMIQMQFSQIHRLHLSKKFVAKEIQSLLK